LRAIDLILEEWDAGEMAGRAALLLHPVRGCRRIAANRARLDCAQQIAAIEALDRRHREAPQTEWQRFQRRMRIVRLLQNEHRTARKPQFAGEEQPDRAGTGDKDIVKGKMGKGHEWLRGRSSFDRSVPRPETHTDERPAALQRPMFVAGIPARSQRPELSLPKGLGLTRPSLPFPTGAI
jgi:hypothetical protein